MNNSNSLELRLGRLRYGDHPELLSPNLNFVFAKGGIGYFLTSSSDNRISPGDVLVFKGSGAGKLVVREARDEFVYRFFWISFESLLSLFDGDEIAVLHRIIASLTSGRIYPAGHGLAIECHKLIGAVSAPVNLNHRGQLLRVAATILDAEFNEELRRHRASCHETKQVVKAFAALSTDELMSLPVSELARRFSCSRRHLCRLFHQHFGISASGLRMEIRMLKAVSLLRDSEARVAKVAGECGFKHLGLFTNCFKRRFGTSPGNWRRSAMKTCRGAHWIFEPETKRTLLTTSAGSRAAAPSEGVNANPATGETALIESNPSDPDSHSMETQVKQGGVVS